MAAHSIPSGRRTGASLPPGEGAHRPSRLAVLLPVLVGVGYGAYAAFIARSGGPATFGQLWLALASGVGMILAVMVMLRFKGALPRELRAAAWGVLAGGAIGFLHSLTDQSVLRSVAVGLAVFVGTALVTHYVFYTHERPVGATQKPPDSPFGSGSDRS